MQKASLSKSLYIRGLQCLKSLWLKKYKSEILTPPDEQSLAIFTIGDEVGKLAYHLFPNGKKVSFKGTTFDEKIALTKQWIDKGIDTIYEATFKFDGILVMVDILHINDDGSVEIYEVKSSTEVKEVHLHDVSIQYYVLSGLSYNIVQASVIHIDNSYVRGDELEIEKLFSIVDVIDEVKILQPEIPDHLKMFQNILSDKKNEPDVDIGKQCDDPYECDAKDYCWRHVPEYSIFDISRLTKDKKFSLYDEGILTFEQIEDIEDFSTAQQIQIVSELEQKVMMDTELIREFLDGLKRPLYYLDFETFQQAIPEWKGVKPYMQIPFQYSLHIEYENGELEHKEFLAKEGADPRYTLAKRLVNDIPDDVMVIAYNMGFEKGVIKKLAETYPEFSEHLMQIHQNMVDLMVPFQKKAYYVPSMRGSYSIKYVLPALVPEMAQAYTELEDVHNGGEAMLVYAKLATIDDKDEIERQRESLLRYCELDTLAMVKILEKLREIVTKKG